MFLPAHLMACERTAFPLFLPSPADLTACPSSSHRLIASSSHRHHRLIFSSLHLFIFSSPHRFIVIHRLIASSPHRLIVIIASSSHRPSSSHRRHLQPLLQFRPRAGEQHFGVGDGDAERFGNFRVRVVLHRVEVEDRALLHGQLPDGL